jgi:twitching motility protein PilT
MEEALDDKKDGSVDVHRLLQTVVDKGASDLHITVGSPPCLRVDGKLYKLKSRPLTPSDTQEFAYSLMTEKQRKKFETDNEVDMSFRWKDRGRFRANFFRQQGCVAGALRMIPHAIMRLDQLGLPPAIQQIIDRPNGLVLVTGPTGSGKSTTLASFIHEINIRHRGHILTIEDPIEFLHSHQNCIVNQREVGSDTNSFANALKYALRQDPDFVLVGEIRDKETMEIGLRIAETGHLTLATLHTNSAVQTIHRILDFFPSAQQDAVRTQLSFSLQCIVSQILLKRADGSGRVLACELLIPNQAIRHLIRDDKTHQIYSQMQVGQKDSGMQTYNQCLIRLYADKKIAKEAARSHSPDLQEFDKMLTNMEHGMQV